MRSPNQNFLTAGEIRAPICCPACGSQLVRRLEAELTCSNCGTRYPVLNGIPRFVPEENYSASFGFQWNLHAQTQLDRYNGLDISKDRFFSQTEWTSRELVGKTVLECGSGAGRFTDVISNTGATLYTIDYSDAVDANARNNSDRDQVFFAQASLYELPFLKNYFDFVVCLGVIQHTPDPAASIRAMVEHLKPGGRFCFDAYAAPMSYLHPRHLMRPVTTRMSKEGLYSIVSRWAPRLLPVSTALHKVPKVGEYLARLIPVANWRQNIKLPHESMYREWAILDTFDWLSPAYEKPQSRKSLENALEMLPVNNVEIVRSRGLYVVRGEKNSA
jgi:SAM-dependent methyltransferase